MYEVIKLALIVFTLFLETDYLYTLQYGKSFNFNDILMSIGTIELSGCIFSNDFCACF